jgi:predicted GIY-YIG superfamily endonuclease
MAIPNDPHLPEFYVYEFYVRGIPFYVGEGRSSRASDRVRFVRYLIDREDARKPVKWVKSNQVVAEFLKRGEEVSVVYAYEGLKRKEALTRELEEIKRLVGAGYRLANHQHNPDRHFTADEIVDFVLSKFSGTVANQPVPPRLTPAKDLARPFPSRTPRRDGERHGRPEAEILASALYDAVVVATLKSTSPDAFFSLVQKAAAKPIVLRDLIRKLIATYRPPSSTKDPEMVIRIRTKDAYTRLGYLRSVE